MSRCNLIIADPPPGVIQRWEPSCDLVQRPDPKLNLVLEIQFTPGAWAEASKKEIQHIC